MAEITSLRTAAESGLADLFDRLKGGLPGDVAVREAALAGFGERGLPHRRVEEFKYFDLRALMRDAPPPAARPDADAFEAARREAGPFSAIDAVEITFVDGHLGPIPGDVLPGIEIVPLADALGRGHPLLAEIGSLAIARGNPILDLNTAFMGEGAIVRVAEGAALDRPIALRFVNRGGRPFSTATRILVSVGAGASVTLIESHEGRDGTACQPNDVVEIRLGDGATLRHVRLNQEGGEALALSTLTARIGSSATFATTNLVAGRATARHQVFATFAGEGSTAQLDGVTLLNGRQHADSTLVVDHAVPHCTSREVYKTILDDGSTGVFQGKIIVRPHAQKTDGAMKSDTLLLSDGATMNNKPELEIFADDVVCGHGATCGALDDDLLFYLKSRGLPRLDAERLLLQAFVGPPLDSIAHEGAREAAIGIVERWLEARE